MESKYSERRVDPLQYLDVNVVAIIVEMLNPVDVVRLRRVSRIWNETLGSEYITRVALLAHFPDSPEALELVRSNARGKAKENESLGEGVSRKRRKKVKEPEWKIPPAVLGFRRATFRLHTRSLAKPSKVHKYRLHHVSEKSFAATSTHLFWAESNRNLWVQNIGEGVGGRRSLRLKAFGDTIAHLYQIAATEGGLVIVLFREVATWLLVLMAIEHETDRVVWKSNAPGIPMGLQVTGNHLYYAVGIASGNALYPMVNGIPLPRDTHVYVHSLDTGRVLHSALLQSPAGCSGVPGSYIIYPPSKPTRIFASFDFQGPSGGCRTMVRVFSIDGAFLAKIALDRPAIDIARYRPDLFLRFTILPATRDGDAEKIMLLESTSRPHIGRHEEPGFLSESQNNTPVLSAWTINPETYEVEEVRRYFSSYADNEKAPSMEVRDDMGNDYTRLECLDPVRGISYIYYDENKSREPIALDDDPNSNGLIPPRAWYERGGARVDSMTYEEKFYRPENSTTAIKEELQSSDTKDNILQSSTGSLEHNSLGGHLVNASTQTPSDWGATSPPTGSQPSSLQMQPQAQPPRQKRVSVSSSKGGSSASAESKGLSQQSNGQWMPLVRQFHQASRHKLVQPDIMRRRRRQCYGEDEEDWQLLPVRTGPLLFTDDKSAGGGQSNDGRFVFLLAKCSGWSITCFVLDFQPEW
ncbi:hypothetical protein DFH27DRAFT_298374 [Peziza echinospora]|nr:hypothetical protein DFH27DRAFT_298374 [Peziza echinospora]